MVFDDRHNLHCRMYHNFAEVVNGYTKVLFAAFEYNSFALLVAIGIIAPIIPCAVYYPACGIFI